VFLSVRDRNAIFFLDQMVSLGFYFPFCRFDWLRVALKNGPRNAFPPEERSKTRNTLLELIKLRTLMDACAVRLRLFSLQHVKFFCCLEHRCYCLIDMVCFSLGPGSFLPFHPEDLLFLRSPSHGNTDFPP